METKNTISKQNLIILPRLLFIGHPFYNYKNITKVLECYGLNVGYEFMKKHGIVSWFASNFFDDNNVSCRKYTAFVRTHKDNFKTIIHFVKDPFYSIPNIINENKNIDSYNYRRDVIKFYYDINLDNYDEPNKSVLSFLYWNNLCVDKSNIDYSIKLENYLDDIKNVLEKLEYKTTLLNEILITNNIMVDVDISYYKNINEDLLKLLDIFCSKYEYKPFSSRIDTENNIIKIEKFN